MFQDLKHNYITKTIYNYYYEPIMLQLYVIKGHNMMVVNVIILYGFT
jgi:hypothetical protein